MSLQNICRNKIIKLLYECHWPCYICDNEKRNPFSSLPCIFVEDLLSAMLQPFTYPIVEHIYPLLSCGQIQKFELSSAVEMDEANFIRTLNILSQHTGKLTTLILQNTCLFMNNEIRQMVPVAIERLILFSPKLKVIEIAMNFNLECIQKLSVLESLKLCFTPVNNLCDMIPQISSWYAKNDVIKLFSVSESSKDCLVPVHELAFILKHWIGLTRVENSIAASLEYSHGSQLVTETLSKRYNLTAIKLGCQFITSATVCAVKIAAITCPDVTELDIYVSAIRTIKLIADFKNLEALSICWNSELTMGDFQLGLEMLLENIGTKLTKLTINNFLRIDLTHIGRFCPNLKCLQIMQAPVILTEMLYFQHLERFYIDCKCPHRARGVMETLFVFFSRCPNIVYIDLNNVPDFNNDTVTALRSLNCFPKLKVAAINECLVAEA